MSSSASLEERGGAASSDTGDVASPPRPRREAQQSAGGGLRLPASQIFLYAVGAALSLLVVGTLILSRASPFYILTHPGSGGDGAFSGGRSVLREWQGGPRDSLVLYIFANSDPEYFENLNYFIQEAVMKDTRNEFIIIMQKDEAKALKLVDLPMHAHYVFHDGDCFDWGTYGWYLGTIDRSKYKYFFFINCSVRGPFIPPMLKGEFEWWEPFVARLTPSTKLVGSAISCEGAPLDGNTAGEWRRNPHVQSFVLATDMVGLDILLADKKVFFCHESVWNTVFYSELGSSLAILKAGFNLDSLMLRYQYIDWKDEANWGCNQKLSPNGENFYDGITLDPYETVFAKVGSYLVDQQVSSAMKAKKYSHWSYLSTTVEERVSVNDYLLSSSKHRTPKILEKIAHGMKCFDTDFYLKKNPDLIIFGSPFLIWKHFVYFGQFEPRQHKFTCPMNYSRFATLGKHQVAWQQRRLLGTGFEAWSLDASSAKDQWIREIQ